MTSMPLKARQIAAEIAKASETGKHLEFAKERSFGPSRGEASIPRTYHAAQLRQPSQVSDVV
jgi:hypothetical protein